MGVANSLKFQGLNGGQGLCQILISLCKSTHIIIISFYGLNTSSQGGTGMADI